MTNAIQERTQAEQDEASATRSYRRLFGILTAVGACLCVTPLAVLGAGMVIAFGLLWLCMPVVEQAEQECIEDTRQTGDGTSAFWRTVGIMLVIGFFAILLGGGAMLAMLGGA